MPEALAPSDDWKSRRASLVLLSSGVDEAFEWARFAEEISSFLGGSGDASLVPVRNALAVFNEMARDHVGSSERLKQLCVEGWVHHHFNRATGAEEWETAARCIQSILLASSPSETPAAQGEAHPGKAVLDAFFANPDSQPGLLSAFASVFDQESASTVWKKLLAGEEATKPFAVALISDAVERSLLADVIPPAVVMEDWPAFSARLAEESSLSRKLLQNLVSESNIVDNVISAEEWWWELLLDLIETPASSQPAFIDSCCSRLADASKDDWDSALRGSGVLLRLLVAVREHAESFFLQDAFQDALFEHAKAIGKGELSVANAPDADWVALSRSLDEADQMNLARRLLAFLVVSPPVRDEFFALYGSVLTQREVLESEPTLLVKQMLPAVQERGVFSLVWIAELLESHPSLLEAFPSDTAQDFEGRIEAALRDDEISAAVAESFRRIAVSLGLDVGDSPGTSDDAESDES